MAKAHIKRTDGTNITIEGTPAQIVSLLAQLEARRQNRPDKYEKKGHKQKPTPINLISSLIDGGFFRKPKDLAAVKVAMEEIGHFYPVTTLSPALLRLVRKRQLRRLKDQKRWLYTG